MALATITKYIEVALPSIEVVVLTVSDGETYKSRKIGVVTGALGCANTDSDAELNVVPSGTDGVITINWASVTDGVATIILFGTH